MFLPGPTLRPDTDADYDHSVSVNLAFLMQKTRYWCSMDPPNVVTSPVVLLLESLATMEIWTDPNMVQQWRTRYGRRRGRHCRFNVVGIPGRGSKDLSMLGAIRGCLERGATEIELRGCDLGGTTYFNGSSAMFTRRRNEGVWGKERAALAVQIRKARDRGVKVYRHHVRLDALQVSSVP